MNENQTSTDGNRSDLDHQTPERSNSANVGADTNTRENPSTILNHNKKQKPHDSRSISLLAEIEARLLRLELSYKILHELLLDETPYKKTPKLSAFGKKLSPRLQGKYRV